MIETLAMLFVVTVLVFTLSWVLADKMGDFFILIFVPFMLLLYLSFWFTSMLVVFMTLFLALLMTAVYVYCITHEDM